MSLPTGPLSAAEVADALHRIDTGGCTDVEAGSEPGVDSVTNTPSSELGFPNSWPHLWTNGTLPRHLRPKYRKCHVCGLMVAHRVARGHSRACFRRRQDQREQWRRWRDAHYEAAS